MLRWLALKLNKAYRGPFKIEEEEKVRLPVKSERDTELIGIY